MGAYPERGGNSSLDEYEYILPTERFALACKKVSSPAEEVCIDPRHAATAVRVSYLVNANVPPTTSHIPAEGGPGNSLRVTVISSHVTKPLELAIRVQPYNVLIARLQG